MKFWISECVRSHKKCREGRQDFLPTRLLDLQAFQGSADVRLVSLALKHSEAEYITLSHCWGPPSKHPTTTSEDNLDQRMRRIAFDRLSQTCQDAIRITRNLDQRYLWIDSLCIIQDDEEDWAREAAVMAKIYGGSLCTFTALSSKDSTEGCHINTNIQSSLSRYLDVDFGPRRVRFFEDEPKYWHSEYGDNPYRREEYGSNPLRKRALECKENKGSTQFPWRDMKPEDDLQPWPIRNDPSESLAPSGPVSLRDRWYELMEHYSDRSLTKERDRLPALSGLVSKFEVTLL